jgi:thiol-disulfide isomerase/thioredoxin
MFKRKNNFALLLPILIFILISTNTFLFGLNNDSLKLKDLSKKFRTERYSLIKENNQKGLINLTKSYLSIIDTMININIDNNKLKLLLMTYIDIGMSALYNGYDNILNRSYAEKIISIVSPTSDIWKDWSWCVFPASYITQKDFNSGYLDSIIKYNPNIEVRERTVYDIIQHANYESNEKVVQKYYNYFIETFPKSLKINDLNKMFGKSKKIKKGEFLPEFEIVNIDDNEKINLNLLSGKFYLIDIWATWCAPCISEMENLHNVYEKFKNKNFEILSISFDADSNKLKEFRIKKWKMPWLNGCISSGLKSNLAELFEISYIPKTILIDQNAKIIAIDRELRGANLEETLTNLIK